LYKKLVSLLSVKFTIPLGAVALFLVAWVTFGLEVGNYFSRAAENRRMQAVANVQGDTEATLRFMKETFMTDPTDFLHPDSEKIRGIAAAYKTPEQIYDFVKKNIIYDQGKSLPSDFATLEQKRSSCFGVAALVVSLLRANGARPDEVHVSVSRLGGGALSPHAWAELKTGGYWTVIDPTTFVSDSYYTERLMLPREEYLAPWPKANIMFEYNDKYFKYDLGF
jgi:hypothetical protein